MSNKTTDPKKCFSENLKTIMKNKNISRNQLSSDLGIKYSTICEWIKGTMLPRADKMEAVANYLNTTSARLLEDPFAEALVIKYPFVNRLPYGYTLEQASEEFFNGWGMVQHAKMNVERFGIVLQNDCNPVQPHYPSGYPVSFIISNKISGIDKDYLIRRDNHDAEIVRVYNDPNNNNKYIFVPVYNIEKDYSSTYEYSTDSADIEIIGISEE